MKPPKPFYKEILVMPEDIEPSSDKMEVVGVFNPGVTEIEEDGVKKTLLMLRVAEAPAEKPKGKILLPYFPVENGPDSPFRVKCDIVDRKDLSCVTKKDATLRNGNLTRLRHISYFKKAISSDGREIDLIEDGSSFYPQYEHERFGVEDPRITKIDGEYVMSYVTPHRMYGVSTSFATTKDFDEFKRLAYWGKPMSIFRDKDVWLFSRKMPVVSGPRGRGKIKQEYAALTRPSSYPGISKPHMCMSFSPDLVHWGPQLEISEKESNRTAGPSAPGVEVKEDGIWLVVYHEIMERGKSNIYRTMLSGFDINEPWKVKYGPKFLFGPGEFDIGPGFVDDAVYTIGMLVRDGTVDLYSGEKDYCVSGRGFYKSDLIKYIKSR